MEITGCWKNRAISFCENGTVLFGNRCSFGIVPSLQQLGHMAGPPLRMAPITLGLPSDYANGPSNLGPRDSQVGAIHRALSGEWTRGAQ